MNPTCKECTEGEIDCYLNIDEGCNDCNAPPIYKCDRADTMNPICRECDDGELDC